MKPIISPNVRIRYPDRFEVGEFSIVDDYCYFSARVKIGFCSHIGNNCSIGGGPERLFSLGDFSSLSAGAKEWGSSNDFPNDPNSTAPSPVRDLWANPLSGGRVFAKFTSAG